MDIVTPEWFSQILTYQGDNVQLSGFEQGINLLVETPFVIGAVIAVLLNAIMPRERRDVPLPTVQQQDYPTQEIKSKVKE